MFFQLTKGWRARKATRSIRNNFPPQRRTPAYPLQPNDIRTVLLSLLDGRPKHAYELMQRLQGRIGGTAKSLYPTLQRLCDEGLVHIDAAFGWRTYWLSDAGKLVLRETNLMNSHWPPARKTGFPRKARVKRFAAQVMRAALRAARHPHTKGSLLRFARFLKIVRPCGPRSEVLSSTERTAVARRADSPSSRRRTRRDRRARRAYRALFRRPESSLSECWECWPKWYGSE